jgi:N-methylhydantoinase A/oxoprolinase/acetone carboxylase beta subunit
LIKGDPWIGLYLSHPNLLERSGVIIRSTFTPTDALHVLGTFVAWDRQAALDGARLLGLWLGKSAEEAASMVTAEVQRQLLRSFATMLSGGKTAVNEGSPDDVLLDLALNGHDDACDLEVTLRSRLPIVGLGAPAGHFVMPVASLLSAPAELPAHHGVANAVGAISGSVVVRETLELQGLYEASGLVGYMLTGPFPAQRFAEKEPALAEAIARATDLARRHAQAAGAAQVEVKLAIEEQEGTPSLSASEKLYLGTRIVATAVGRPQFAASAVPVARLEQPC